MKKHYKHLIILYITLIVQFTIQGQTISLVASFSPGSNTLIGSATRIGYDYNQWSTYYMRYNDSAYFSGHYLPGYWGAFPPSIVSYTFPLPDSLIITDFKYLLSDPGFIGSYQDKGMYGRAESYIYVSNYNHLFFYTFPDVNRLKRIALVRASHLSFPQIKAFAIGEKDVVPGRSRQSYIMEFLAAGIGALPDGTYYYAPMPYDSITDRQERVDDVIIVKNYVVFATQDTRKEHAPVNLRISDTNNVLNNSDIDFQWRFWLRSGESVVGEIRLLPLKTDEFIMAYVIFNTRNDLYYLCTHKIILSDFLTNTNTIISHKIDIKKECSNLVDMIYEPDVNTMVILLNGEHTSNIYHADPFATTPTHYFILEHPEVSFQSIDTVGNYTLANYDMYVAAGDSTFFHQDISNGPIIESSCLQITTCLSSLRRHPVIDCEKDPIERFFNNREYTSIEKLARMFTGIKECDNYGTLQHK